MLDTGISLLLASSSLPLILSGIQLLPFVFPCVILLETSESFSGAPCGQSRRAYVVSSLSFVMSCYNVLHLLQCEASALVELFPWKQNPTSHDVRSAVVQVGDNGRLLRKRSPSSEPTAGYSLILRRPNFSQSSLSSSSHASSSSHSSSSSSPPPAASSGTGGPRMSTNASSTGRWGMGKPSSTNARR